MVLREDLDFICQRILWIASGGVLELDLCSRLGYLLPIFGTIYADMSRQSDGDFFPKLLQIRLFWLERIKFRELSRESSASDRIAFRMT